MTLQTISIDVSKRRIATIVLNRPERGNALNQTMLDELHGQFTALAADDHVRMVVLRGSGKHFCTGADLADREVMAPAGGARASSPATLFDVLIATDTLPKPTVAVVHGGCIGGGAAIASCCDIVIVTESAFFSIPEVRIGMAPRGLSPFLMRAIGYRHFRRYGLSGERIVAAEALRIGLAHEMCDSAALETTVARISDELLHGAPEAVAELKRTAAEFASPPWSSVLASRPTGPRVRTAEMQEGIASFREKRKPKWYPE